MKRFLIVFLLSLNFIAVQASNQSENHGIDTSSLADLSLSPNSHVHRVFSPESLQVSTGLSSADRALQEKNIYEKNIEIDQNVLRIVAKALQRGTFSGDGRDISNIVAMTRDLKHFRDRSFDMQIAYLKSLYDFLFWQQNKYTYYQLSKSDGFSLPAPRNVCWIGHLHPLMKEIKKLEASRK